MCFWPYSHPRSGLKNGAPRCGHSKGQPTAIFEDPFPLTSPAPGTDQPKQQGGQMPFMRQPPAPKGDLDAL